MLPTRSRVSRYSTVIGFLALIFASTLSAQVPDLTNGEVRTNDVFWNLGPTGMRGWVYHEGAHSTLSRQIEVTSVDAAGPSNGILDVGDVILGADGTGANPVAFTSDARIAFARAIADAEANNPAILKILRWRAGVTDTVSVTLEYLGAYSATAPYNCPKSAAILEKGLDALMANGEIDSNKLGIIALLAAYDESDPDNAARMARAQQEAHSLILTQEQIDEYTSGISLQGSKVAWHHGIKMMALGEYYLHTGDAAVYESLRAYAIAYANGQSMFGTAGHNFALPGPNGEINGPYAKGYGVVNSANMQCFYGALLAREAGVTDQVVLDAIERASRFYGSYAHRGSIPYGEHQPGGGHESNGKSGAAAACFALEGTRDADAKFNIKMAGASADTRDRGHTGPWFNYFWAPIGANMGGEESIAAFFAEQSWHYDLSRNWDGSFTFDTFGQGKEQNGQSYWSNIRLQQYMTALITYAMPLKQTYITGKNRNPALTLSAAELSEVQTATHYDPTSRTTNQLIQDLETWSPPQRSQASKELGLRTAEHATILPILHTMATDINESTYARMGACFALGEILDDSSVPVLAGLLTDPSNLVRWAAANGLDGFSQEARLAVIDTLLSACITTARPLLPLDPEDPIHLTHARVASAVFGGQPRGALWGHDLVGIDRELLYGAIRAVANHPQGAVRSYVGNVYSALSREDVEALADALVTSVHKESPADRMFAQGIRFQGADLLQAHNFAEGVGLAKILTEELRKTESLDTLINYAGDSLLVEPDQKILEWLDILEAGDSDQTFTAASNWPDPGTHNHIQWVRDAINGDPGPYEKPEPFKRIHKIFADDVTLTLPDYWTGLHVYAEDLAKGDTVYTWRKVHGAGEVDFYPNGTNAAKDTTVVFDGVPGEYLFEVKLSDSLGLTEVTQTVAVTLEKVGGGLDPNSAPTADDQSVTVVQGTPTQIILTGSDPEGLPLVYTVTNGPANGNLSGTAPNLVYTAASGYTGSDSITFEAMDSEGQVASGTINITVNTSPAVGLAIYEPFEGYPVDGTTTINGLSGTGEIGLDGTWTSGSNIRADDTAPVGLSAGGYTYGPLPVTGSKLWTKGGAGDPAWRSINADALANSGLLADGSTLWFSALIGADDTWLRNVKIALANASFDANKSNIKADGPDLGTGLGFELNADKNFYAAQYIDATEGDPLAPGAPILGDFNEAAAGKFVRFGDLRLVVAKITWGATSDKVEVYLPLLPEPGAGIVLPDAPSSTLVANVDQSKFDVLTISRGHEVWVDEIRVGASLQSVLMGTVAGAADDGVAPAPDPMAFAVAPLVAGADSITMTATPAYDPLGVEYYFTCTAGGGSDSGWQDSNVYTDTGLTPGVAYSYTVKARDKTPGLNETAASAAASATIPSSGTVPDVIGLGQSIAETQLTDAGMTVGTVTNATEYSLTVPAGHVISQTPAGSTSTAYGSTVNLVISIGQDPALPTISPVDFVDNHGGGPVTLPEQFLYTLTFSQDMDLATIDAGDFVSLDGYPITIGAINEISPGVVTVEVLPDSIDSGLLILAIAQGAVIQDASGNALNTTSAIADDDAITIIRPANYLPVVDAGPDQEISTQSPQPWTPSSMTTTAWYDAADLGSIIQSGGAVSQWNDKSGNGFHATQTNTTNMPVSGTRSLNGRNVLDFTTANSQSLSIPATDIIGKEVWAVMLVDDFSTAGSQLVMGGGGNSQVGIQSSSQQLRLWQSSNPYAGDSKSAATVSQGAPALLGWLAHNDTKKYSVNGVLQDTGDSYSSGTMAPNNIGRGQYACMDGILAEVIVTDGALSVAERERLEGYLAHKWGLEANLPAGHPYKSAAPTESSWATALDGTVSDADGDPLSTVWAQISGPAVASVSDASAVDTSAVFPAAGDYVFQLSANDGIDLVADQVTITVTQGEDTTPPTLASSSIVDDRGGADVVENDLVTYTVTFSEDMDAATVDASDFSNAGTSSVTIGAVTENSPGVFTVEATPTNAGSLQLEVSAGAMLSDIAGNALDTSSAIADDTTITVTASVSNDAPVFTVDPIAGGDATEDSAYSGSIAGSATDADGDTLTYAKVSGPAWLSVAGDGTLSGIPTNADVGVNTFTVSVTDSIAAPVNATLNISVINSNDAPMFAVDPINGNAAQQDIPYSGTLDGTATDDDGDPLTYALVSGPVWLSVAGDGTLSGTPTSTDLGPNVFTVSVTDNIAPPVEATLNISVTEQGAEEVVTLAEVFAHNENDNYTGIPTDLINGSGMNGHPDTGVTGWPTGEGLPSTWTATLDTYRAEHQSRNFLEAATPSEDLDPTGALLPDGVGPTNGKVGWYIIDIGEVTTGLQDLYIWHIRETSTRIAADFNIYVAEAPTVAVAHGPTGTANARDYDFASGGWTLVQSGVAGVFRDFTVTPLNGATARYIGLEIMANSGDTSERVGFAEVGLTRTGSAGANAAPEWVANPINETDATEDTAYAATLADDATDADSDPLTFAKVSGPAWLSVAADGNLSGTPNNADVGANVFTVSVTDGINPAVDATLNISVLNTNDTPVANDDSATTDEDTGVAITLTASDADVGDTLTYSVVSGPANGSLSGTAPNLTYTPNGNYNGSDSFTFKANDGTVDSNIATVSITVNAVNDAPIANDDAVATDEDTAVAITLTGSDVDLDPLSYAVVTGPTNGTLSGTAPDLTYTPNVDYNGSDSFTFKVNDGLAESNTATISIAVNAVNDAPVANDDSVTTDEDVAVAITLAASDVDTGDTLTYAVVTGPANGTLSGTAPNLTYTPNATYNGSDSFTFKANDGTVDSNIATVSITVNGVNNAPVANDDAVTTDEDTSTAITLTASDADSGDTLAYAVVTAPANGVLTGTAPDLTYTPNADYNGSDSFTFKANDGTVDSNIATVSITVNSVNDAPVFVVDPIVGTDATQDLAYTGTIAGSATDVDTGATLTYSLASAQGWLFVASDGSLSGTPASGDVGLNSFTVSVSDGIAAPVTATLEINVVAGEDTTAPNPDPMTWAVVPATAGGGGSGSGAMTLSTTAPAVDGLDLTNDAAVIGESLVWTDRPVSGQTFTTGADAAVLNSLTLKLEDGLQTKTYVVRVGTISGTTFTEIHSETFTQNFDIGINEYVTWEFLTPVSLQANTQYGIDVGLTGSTSGWSTGIPGIKFSSDVYAGGSRYTSGNGGVGDTSITTFGSDDLIFHLDMATAGGTSEDAITMTATTATDASGVEYYFTETSGNPGGNDSGWQDSPVYTDTGLQAGTTYTYTVTARDKSTNQNTTAPSTAESATTAGSPPNQAPVFASDPVNESDATEDAAYSSTLADNASDGDGDPLTFAKVSGPAWLNVAADGTLSGTPGNADVGANTFTVSVTDGIIATPVEAALNITVINTNDAPVFTANPITAADASEDLSYSATISGSATDDDGDTLTFAKVSGPAWLSVAADGTLSGTPTNADVGANAFTVSVTDGIIATPVEATLNITVLNVNDAPVFFVDPISTMDATVSAAYSDTIAGTATDDDGDTLTYAKVSGPAWLVVAGNGDLSGSPTSGDVGANAFTVSVSDGNGGSDTATLNINVNPAPSSMKMVRTTVNSVTNGSWVTVDLGQTYTSPVIVATPIHAPGQTTPVVTRINNITATSFDLKLDRADGSTGAVSFDVSVVAVEEGVYTQAIDGVTMEAVKYTSTVTASGPNAWNGEARSYQNSYTTPVVIGQVMSYNDSNWSVFWSMGASRQDAVDATNLNVGKHVGQDQNGTRGNETVGYIVIESGNGTLDGVAYEAGLGPATVQCFGDSSTPYSYALSGSLSTVSTAAVSQSGMSGNDGAWAVLSGSSPVTTSSLSLHLSEDSFKDNRQRHSAERVGYIVFE